MTSTNTSDSPKIEIQARNLDSCRSALESLGVWLSPHRPNRAPWPGIQGQLSPLIARLGPPDSLRVETVGPCACACACACARARVVSSRGRGRSLGKPREFLSTSSHDTCTQACSCCVLRHRSDNRHPQAGRFDQPCGKTVPSGNPGAQCSESALLHTCWRKLRNDAATVLRLARPSALSLIFSWPAVTCHDLSPQSLNATSTSAGSAYAGSRSALKPDQPSPTPPFLHTIAINTSTSSINFSTTTYGVVPFLFINQFRIERSICPYTFLFLNQKNDAVVVTI